MADQTPKPPKPRLKKGESPQDPSFQTRLRKWHRQIALLEVNKAQAEQNEREAAERAKRDVLKEAETGPTTSEPETAEEAVDQGIAEADADNPPRKGIRGAADAIANSANKVDDVVDEMVSGKKKKVEK